MAGDSEVIDRGDDFIPTDDDVDTETAKDEQVNGAEEPKDEPKEEPKEEPKDEPKEDGKRDKKTIPESRFNEAIRKYKDREEALKAKIAELEKGVATTKTSADIEEVEGEIENLQDQYEEALGDNNKAKLKELRGKIRAFERQLIDLKAAEKASAAKAETLEELRYEAAISRVEADYPIINQDSDEFDESKAAEVLDLRNAMMRNGLTAAKALQKAVKYVLGEPASAKSRQEIEDTKTEREQKAREKAADANKKQPPDMARVGLDSDKAGGEAAKVKSVAKMSQDAFAKLDEDTLSKLRGDTV